ncbi:MAG: hypothetical protein KJ702_14345 [Gammaproteobacteria bacterium]|nr:hypothetical protein [Gammaproteobacteria bacterium]
MQKGNLGPGTVSPDTAASLEREVSAHPGEFRHGLLLAFPGCVTENDGMLRVAAGPAAMEILLTPKAPRVIASLRLPNLQVNIRFTAGTPAEQQAMLAHMDRAMHRGGG